MEVCLKNRNEILKPNKGVVSKNHKIWEDLAAEIGGNVNPKSIYTKVTADAFQILTILRTTSDEADDASNADASVADASDFDASSADEFHADASAADSSENDEESFDAEIPVTNTAFLASKA